MPSRKEAQSGRIEQHGDRCYSSTERAYTTHAGKHYNVATQQINTADASDSINFSARESPAFPRLPYLAYGPSKGSIVNQSHLSLFQRSKSSASLPKVDGFSFGARRDRQMNTRKGRQQQIRPNFRTGKSTQRTQSAEKASEAPRAKYSPLPIQPSKPSELVLGDSATTLRIDLTREPPSTAWQATKPTNTIENAPAQQERICQKPSANVKHGPRGDYFVRNGLDDAAVCYTDPLCAEAKPHSPSNIMPIDRKGNAPSERYRPNIHHLLQAANAPLLFSEAASPPVACRQLGFLSPTDGQTHISKEETQSCSTLTTGSHATPRLLPDARHHLRDAPQQRTVRVADAASSKRIQVAVSKEGKSVPSSTEEALKLDASHTLRTNACRAVENPMRVCKAVANPPPAQQPATFLGQHVTAVSSRPTAPSRDTLPSKEDIFYVLMHMQRQQKEAQTRAMVRQKQLETANARLAQQNDTFRHQLSAACTSRDQSAAEVSLQKAAMENFKARFQKLKGFVNGLINDYDTLRQQADKMKNSQQSLVNEKEHLYRELKGYRIASAASEQTMRNIVSTVAKIRQSMEPSERSVADSRETLDGGNRFLSDEQKKNKTLETYLFQVAHAQSRYGFAIQNEQKMILDQLRDIANKIHLIENATAAEPQPLELRGLNECVRMLTKLHDADRVVLADIAQVTDAVRTLSQSLLSYRKSSDERIQAASDDQMKLNQLVPQITTLLESLHASFVPREQISHLREDKIRLEEQLKSSKNVVQEIQDSRTSADARESHLRSMAEGLLNELKTLRSQPPAVHQPRRQVDERDMISTWQMKYTTISQRLTDSEERLNRREKEIRQGEEDVKRLTGQLERARAERDIAVRALSEAKDRQHVSEKQQAIESLERRIKEAETGTMRIAQLEENALRSAEEISALKGKLRVAEESASSAAEQQEDFDRTTKEAEELRKKLASLKLLVDRFSTLQEEAQGHLDEVIRVPQELRNAKNSVGRLQDLRETDGHRSAEIASRQKQISAADSKLKRLQSVKGVCDRKDLEMATLNERLRVAEDNLSHLRASEEAISDNILTLNRELDAQRNSSKHLKSAKDANGRKDEEMAFLEQRLGAIESILNDVQVVGEERQRKGIELSALKDKLTKMAEISQQLLQTLAERPSQTHGASQRMAAIQDRVAIDDTISLPRLAVIGVPSRDPAHQPGREGNRNDSLAHTQELHTAITETVHFDSQGKQCLPSSQIFDTTEPSHPALVTGPEILKSQETALVPESQPVADSPYQRFPPYLDSMSSPLTDIGSFIEPSDEVHSQSVYFGPEKAVDGPASTLPANFAPSSRGSIRSPKDLPSSMPPSSSYGDIILLEAEELRNLDPHGTTTVLESSIQRPDSQFGSTSPGRSLGGASEGTTTPRIQKLSSKTAKIKGKRDPRISPEHPSPRRPRSKSQIKSKVIMPLRDRTSSDQNIPVSPLRGMLPEKYLAHSAAKRRLEDDEMSVPSSHDGCKRLKRNLFALEAKASTNSTGSSFHEQATPATDTRCLGHPSMPTGDRKGEHRWD